MWLLGGYNAPGQRRFRLDIDPGGHMTLLWFFIWLIWDLVGDEEPLTFNPVNWWAGSLLFVIALDLSAVHARTVRR